MNNDAEVIEFRVPTENSKTLFVWDILPTFSEAYIYEALWEVFSGFGALYWLKVAQNARVAQPGFYAVVKFYSAAQASRAQSATHSKGLFQKSPLKVQLCTKWSPAEPRNVRPLSVTKCQELANHYLGFNGWSSQVVTLKDISGIVSGEQQPSVVSPGTTLKYGCIMELNFPLHGVTCRGIGITEEVFEGGRAHLHSIDAFMQMRAKLAVRAQEPPFIWGPWSSFVVKALAQGPKEEINMKRGPLQKRARDRAMMDAFRKVLLIILGNRRVVVGCKVDEDLEGVVKVVNNTSWSVAEEEDFPDLTLNLPHSS